MDIAKDWTAYVVGCDAHGVPRVFANGKNWLDAENEVQAAIVEYVERRPDTGPASDWTIKSE